MLEVGIHIVDILGAIVDCWYRCQVTCTECTGGSVRSSDLSRCQPSASAQVSAVDGTSVYDVDRIVIHRVVVRMKGFTKAIEAVQRVKHGEAWSIVGKIIDTDVKVSAYPT